MAIERSIRFSEIQAGGAHPLTDRLTEYFSAPGRFRGEAYFLQGRVVITRGAASVVTGRVRGTSRPYNVSASFASSVLVVACECAAFETSGACKHLWALLLSAEQQTFLSEATSSPELSVREGDSVIVTASGPGTQPATVMPQAPRRLDWKKQIDEISRQRQVASMVLDNQVWPDKRQIRYVVDAGACRMAPGIALTLESLDLKQNGTYSRPAAMRLRRGQIARLPVPEDRLILSALSGGRARSAFSIGSDYDTLPDSLQLSPELARTVFPDIVKTGRCLLRLTDETKELIWDDGGEWQFVLEMRATQRGWGAAGILRRGAERAPVEQVDLVTEGGFVFHAGRVAPLRPGPGFEWIVWLRGHGVLEASDADRDQLLAHLLCTPGMPEVEVPPELAFDVAEMAPRPRLLVSSQLNRWQPANTRLRAALQFDYASQTLDSAPGTGAFFDAVNRRLIRRDAPAEASARDRLTQLGVRYVGAQPGAHGEWDLAPTKLAPVVRDLTASGWAVEADGRMFRAPGRTKLSVASGVDWFDLNGTVDFDGAEARLPELLAALRRGEGMVRLDDGSFGLLPEEWLRRIAMIAGMGESVDGEVRFRRAQAGLLDALLAAQPEATFDETFSQVRKELLNFSGVRAAEQPAGFQGELRGYQKEGLGWMEFLRRFSFGGCLADDMGTGKTAQVLALLESRRAESAKKKKRTPSLIVVPRSLIFNWKEESARFTPKLRILDYTGPERSLQALGQVDIVLTTYGTLRRDVTELQAVTFDYAILDEAQMVKNAGTDGAKAVRLIRAEHRLALSGTPVENHLGELWSMFEYLNPGMLGNVSVLKIAGGASRNPDEETRALLAQALRPFILRRTKEQVVKELPARTEQTIYCELEPKQRQLYNELRDHYRGSLLARVAKDGLAKSKMMVLEALLRLRQAACHPGLIDPRRKAEPGAKLEALFDQLREVLDSGHKALVFSQFTSLLAILRTQLDAAKITYEYLDGKTRDRQQRVDRFQTDSDCGLFLISLKAGGLGLNLTAADYVFLLDPWWNPAVEAQAIDRAHRIGQVRQVSAYRLIARDTVEEKVLELQKSKRDLAAAIIGESNSVIRDLKREDLELLLS